MAGITTIGHRTSIPTLYDHFFFTSSRLRRHPLTVGLAAELDPVRPLIDAAWLKELGLIKALYESEAAEELAAKIAELEADLGTAPAAEPETGRKTRPGKR